MTNYEYIIASLPVLPRDWKSAQGLDPDAIVSFIKSQCDSRDSLLVEQVLEGFDHSALGEKFYREALGERPRPSDFFSAEPRPVLPPKNAFVKGYFTFDLHVRNEKVRFLNKALGRARGQDIFLEPEGEFPEREQVKAILAEEDILARERDLDMLMWNKASNLATFDYFDIDAVLSFLVRLKITARWLALDEKTGMELFRRLVDEVRGTFKGIDFSDNK